MASRAGRKGSARSPRRGNSALLAAVLLLCVPATSAPTDDRVVYTLELPSGRPVTYRIEVEVEREGRLTAEVEWSGNRNLSLRVDGPVEAGDVLRRSGPSPQRLEVEVPEAWIGTWKITIHALASRAEGTGHLTIAPPSAPSDREADSGPVDDSPPSQPREPWEVEVSAPGGAPLEWDRLFRTTEQLRSLVVTGAGSTAPDSCGWQADLLRYVAAHRDGLSSGDSRLAGKTRAMLQRIADSIRAVDDFRSPAAPVPAPPTRTAERRAWVQRRADEVRELEKRLDVLMHELRRDHVPELAGQTWPLRLVGCLAACERHFEERQRMDDDLAINRDLAAQQWETMLAAEEALRALVLTRPW